MDSIANDNNSRDAINSSDIRNAESPETEGMPANNSRARIFKRLWSPGIDSKEWIPPAYVAWRAGTITLFLLGS